MKPRFIIWKDHSVWYVQNEQGEQKISRTRWHLTNWINLRTRRGSYVLIECHRKVSWKILDVKEDEVLIKPVEWKECRAVWIPRGWVGIIEEYGKLVKN